MIIIVSIRHLVNKSVQKKQSDFTFKEPEPHIWSFLLGINKTVAYSSVDCSQLFIAAQTKHAKLQHVHSELYPAVF